MNAVDSLGFSRRIELRFHHVDFACCCEIETKTTCADTNEDDRNVRVIGKGYERAIAGFAVHATIESSVLMALTIERNLDQIEMGSPVRENDAEL